MNSYCQLRKISVKKAVELAAAGKRIFSTLQQRSAKRAAEDRVRYGPKVLGVVKARSGGICEEPGCPAGRGGSRIDPDNIMHTCRPHHDKKHAENDLKSGHRPISPSPSGVPFVVGGAA